MPGERPALVRKLATALDGPGAPRAGEHLLVAVSGGPDSTALLVALAELASTLRLAVTAAHVDHGLRGAEGAAEAARVGVFAGRLGVPFVSRAVALAPGPGLEARANRYFPALRATVRVGHTPGGPGGFRKASLC